MLRARGFVTPQPKKRPKSSYTRFAADLPNERWQADMTHVPLPNGCVFEVLNMIDDHSRLCVASRVMNVVKAHDVIRVLHKSAETWGYPASLLTDNGLIFTARTHFGVEGVVEQELFALGITAKHSRPYHPQTCGKVCEHDGGAAPDRSDPGQGVTKVSFVRFVDRSRCCTTARPGRTDLT